MSNKLEETYKYVKAKLKEQYLNDEITLKGYYKMLGDALSIRDKKQ